MRRLPLALALACVLAASAAALGPWRAPGGGTVELLLYVDRTLQGPVEELVEAFEELLEARGYDVKVTVVYGSSGYVLSQLELIGRGDLYVSDDIHFAKLGAERGLLKASTLSTVGYLELGLVVRAGNPKGISSLLDALGRSDVRVAVGNPEHVSAGVLARKALERKGLWELVEEGVREGRVVYAESAAKAASYVRMGVVDAAVTFTVFATLYDDLEVVDDPALSGVTAPVIVALPTEHGPFARELYEFVLGNREVFYRYGVSPG